MQKVLVGGIALAAALLALESAVARGSVFAAPSIGSFAPHSGGVRSTVTVSGSGFIGAKSVSVGGVAAPFLVLSDDELTLTVPAGATSGPIAVTTPGGVATSNDDFTVAAQPTISSFAPSQGPAGSQVTITGTGLTHTAAVEMSGIVTVPVSVSDTAVTFVVPPGSSGGQITVSTPYGSAISTGSFLFLHVPVIESFSPSSGPPGTTVSIQGMSLTGATVVAFDGVPAASFSVRSDTGITAVVPTDAGSGPVSITTPLGTATSTGSFVVVPAPTITSFTPSSGRPGFTVTITGTHLSGATRVTFDGTSATYTVTGDTTVTATVPAHGATGPIAVTTPGGTATSSTSFTIPLPSVTGFSPAYGPAGTAVTISGTHLDGATSVTFGGVSASFTVVSTGSITATVPEGGTPGPIAVTTTTGASTSSGSFTVTVPISMSVTGSDQVVFDWTTDRCDDIDYPDLPARAFRDASGNVQLIATHYENRRMIGPDLDHLTHPCDVVLPSDYNTDPSAFDDYEWLSAPYTTDGTHVYALIHDEYDAWEIPGACSVPFPQSFTACWYNAITLAVSSDGGASYHDATPGLVAGVPFPYVDGNGMDGVFTPSNIVHNPADGYYYAFGYVNERQSYIGNCLFRTKNLADPTSWRAWSGGNSFDMTFVDPYGPNPDPSAHLCRPLQIGFPADLQPNSLTYSTVAHEWMLVGMAAAGDYYTLSPDLVHWSTPVLFYRRLITWTYQCGDPDPTAYPSLIDPSSTSMNFTTTGTTAYLYFTVFHYVDCAQTEDRDLVRVPVTISPAGGG